MKKVKEGIEIEVRETDEPKLRDMEFSLNTATSGIASFTTEKITGELLGIVVDADGPIKLSISASWGDLITLPNIVGIEYLSLGKTPLDFSGASFSTPWPYYLNESLSIEISGAMSTNVKFNIRYRSI